jgi:hypothetical protein
MQKTLWNLESRAELMDRLELLRPDAKPLWGKMNAPQMVSHVISWMMMANGDLRAAPRKRILRFTPVKQLVIHWLPWPKGVPTAQELLERAPSEWSGERDVLRQLIENFETDHRNKEWPVHPAFGRLTTGTWGVLGYRHTDHHFRQFGV